MGKERLHCYCNLSKIKVAKLSRLLNVQDAKKKSYQTENYYRNGAYQETLVINRGECDKTSNL